MSPLRNATAAVALGLLLAGCTPGSVVLAGRSPAPEPAGGTPSSSAPQPGGVGIVTVEGEQVPAARARDVAEALAAAHVGVPPGQVLAVASHQPLGTDDQPGHVLVNGALAAASTPLSPGDRVTVVAGADRVEALRSQLVTLPPPNPSNLYVGGRPGHAREWVGVRSGEVVSTRVLLAPRIGHLVAPGAVALTFDDGPDPTWTPLVLRLLAKAHVHATFCLIGREAAQHPRLVRAIVAHGHALCDHTWDHDLQLRIRPAGQIALDILQGARAIRRAGGVAPVFFRAPGGNWSAAIESDARAQHLVPLKWTVDPRDWSRPGVATILSTVNDELRPGGVILLHDGGGNRFQTVAALRVLLTRLPAMGYRFVLPPQSG